MFIDFESKSQELLRVMRLVKRFTVEHKRTDAAGLSLSFKSFFSHLQRKSEKEAYFLCNTYL